MRIKNTPEKFWGKVTISGPDDCWEWQGSFNSNRYGRFMLDGIRWLAHVLAYTLTKGFPGDKKVCHTCDNTKCCNPAHLFLGTQQDNIADMIQKKRHHVGEARYGAKLTELDVANIKVKAASGAYGILAQLAREYKVSHTTIWSIATGKKWARHETCACGNTCS